MVLKKQNLCLNTYLNVNRLPLLLIDAVLKNHEILDSNRNRSQLAFLEAYYIKNYDPIINHTLKASKELSLFNLILNIHLF